MVFELVPRRRVFECALQEAAAQGKMTPELAHLSDRGVEAVRLNELLIAATIVVLMVTKPF